MFFDDPRKAAQTLLSKRDGHGKKTHESTPMKSEVVKHEDGEIDGRHTAMQDFMAAHKEGSPMKMAEAMINFIDIHNASPDSTEDSAIPSV